MRSSAPVWIPGEHAEIIGDLEAAISAEPLGEKRWSQLMLALYRCGRQTGALRAFQRLQSMLAEELGIDPSRELRELEEAILNQDQHLDHRPSPGDGATTEGAVRSLRARSADPLRCSSRTNSLAVGGAQRTLSLLTIGSVYLTDFDHVVNLGIGKTSLMAKLAQRAAACGCCCCVCTVAVMRRTSSRINRSSRRCDLFLPFENAGPC